MNGTDRGKHAASPSALGYLYQVRYALFEALQRLRSGQDFLLSIETLDDITFENTHTDALDLLQTKHHVNKTADLSDYSPDLWKSLRVWCDALTAQALPQGATYLLITTAHAATGSAAQYLKS